MAEQPSPTSELQHQLQLLSEKFAERLAQELPELASKAQLLQAGDHKAQLQQLRSLRDQLHKLAGAAGTFGFASIGQRARELEQQATHWLESLRLQDQGLQEFILQLQQFAAQPVQSAAAPKSPARPQKPLKAETEVHCIYILEDEVSIGENMRLT
ncbi:Hpt domain-containing protein, partial [Pseudomonas sp.]|uniref:Hpt domain-containing protein n=1 Tax=Pseudomonas sp. TaxID=306 RepID=UPI003568D1E5